MDSNKITIEQILNGLLTDVMVSHLLNKNGNEVIWHNELDGPDGSKVKIKRKMAYMYHEIVDYKYANLSFKGQLWTKQIKALCQIVNNHTKNEFNSVLLNYYSNGKDEIKWHSDKEESLGDIKKSVIATVNLGATRKFWFLNKETGVKDFISVENGDLLMMKEGFQDEYLHAILPEKEVTEGRISLTFRKVVK